MKTHQAIASKDQASIKETIGWIHFEFTTRHDVSVAFKGLNGIGLDWCGIYKILYIFILNYESIFFSPKNHWVFQQISCLYAWEHSWVLCENFTFETLKISHTAVNHVWTTSCRCVKLNFSHYFDPMERKQNNQYRCFPKHMNIQIIQTSNNYTATVWNIFASCTIWFLVKT